MIAFRQALTERVLVLDGAMGTLLQERGLKAGGCPEDLNRTAPETVAGIHREYADAGADILVTNTFGANRSKLAHYALQDRVGDLNQRAVEIACRAGGGRPYVAGSVGPTGRFVEPIGDCGFLEMVEIFAEQISALVKAGVDLISFETFLDIRELRAGVVACKDICNLPIIAQMTFDDAGRTVLGTSPEAAAVTLDALQVDVVGSNCGLGIDGIYQVLEKMRSAIPRPLIAQANAGLPTLMDGETVFPASPDDMTTFHERLVSLGVRIIGGCCGTTPRHIATIKESLANYPQNWQPPARKGYLSSRTSTMEIGNKTSCRLIGERINPTGKKSYTDELRNGKTAFVRNEATQQVAAGAHLLDINCGAPGVDEPLALERAVHAVSGTCTAPLVIDTSDAAALERALQAADGKVLINSVNGEAKSLEVVLPLARRYGAAVIGLTLDERGIPGTAEERLQIARRILNACLAAGLPKEDLLIDCLTLTVSAEQARAMETLKAIRLVRSELGLGTVLGVSNISFGLPARPVLSSVFFSMALEAGLSAAIVNPKDERMMDAYRAARVLLHQDLRAENYIAHYANSASPPSLTNQSPKEVSDLRNCLIQSIVNGDIEGIVPLIEVALAEGLDSMTISNEGLIPGLEEVGRRFASNQIFLPQVMQSAEAMQKAFRVLKVAMPDQAGDSLGKILMATVEGDIHDIGKNIVCTLLENHGFEVIDLGKNVPADKILAAAMEHQVDAVGLSALMTTTINQMNVVLTRLRESGIKVFTMVGGAVVTQDYADEIGADIYAHDALEAVAKAKRLLSG